MNRRWVVGVFLMFTLAGCQTSLKEVRSKWKTGPELRRDDNEHWERWTVQTGVEGKWANGWTTGVTYRSRFNNDIDGFDANDHGMWLEFGFPLWKAREPEDDLADRVQRLEELVRSLRQDGRVPESIGEADIQVVTPGSDHAQSVAGVL